MTPENFSEFLKIANQYKKDQENTGILNMPTPQFAVLLGLFAVFLILLGSTTVILISEYYSNSCINDYQKAWPESPRAQAVFFCKHGHREVTSVMVKESK